MNMLQDMKALPISLPWIMTILNKVKRDEQAGQGQLDLAAIEALVLNINITKYVLMVAVALWIYDFLLTFDDEVELFWKKKDGIVIKVLYLMVSLYILFT